MTSYEYLEPQVPLVIFHAPLEFVQALQQVFRYPQPCHVISNPEVFSSNTFSMFSDVPQLIATSIRRYWRIFNFMNQGSNEEVMTELQGLHETISNWDNYKIMDIRTSQAWTLSRVVKRKLQFTTWPFHIGLKCKILTLGVKVMAPEIWGKILKVNWAVSGISVCRVFNSYNFLKICLMVGLGCWE